MPWLLLSIVISLRFEASAAVGRVVNGAGLGWACARDEQLPVLKDGAIISPYHHVYYCDMTLSAFACN